MIPGHLGKLSEALWTVFVTKPFLLQHQKVSSSVLKWRFFFWQGDNILISSMMLQEQIQSSEVQLGEPKKEGTLESDQN
jgi:hypothetical protein